MNPILRNILGVIAGIFIGGALNMAIVMLGSMNNPAMVGVDMNDMEAFKEAMSNFTTVDFLYPLLAHALGTLVGAFIAAKIAGTKKMMMALIIGAFFMIGGIMNVIALPAPLWMEICDLALAYIPMAWIGGKLATK